MYLWIKNKRFFTAVIVSSIDFGNRSPDIPILKLPFTLVLKSGWCHKIFQTPEKMWTKKQVSTKYKSHYRGKCLHVVLKTMWTHSQQSCWGPPETVIANFHNKHYFTKCFYIDPYVWRLAVQNHISKQSELKFTSILLHFHFHNLQSESESVWSGGSNPCDCQPEVLWPHGRPADSLLL